MTLNSLNTYPITDNVASEPNHENIWNSEHSAENDYTELSNEITERATSTPEGSVENTVSGVPVNDLSLEDLGTSFSSETRFAPSVLSRDDYTSNVVQVRFDSTSGMVPEMSQFLQGSAINFLSSELNQGNIGISEHCPEIDCNVMLNENPESATTLPEGFVENTDSGVSVSDFPLAALGTSFSSETRFVPSTLSRGSLPESPVGTNVKPNSRKRPLEEDSSPVPAEGNVSASRKKRVRAPSKKERVLNLKMKELENENKESKAEVKELSESVEFFKNYITSKLRGQCYFCKNYLPRERPAPTPEGLVENTVSGLSMNDLSCKALETSFSNETRFVPSVLSGDNSTSNVVLLSSDSPNEVVPEMPQSLLESPVGTNVKADSRKRPLAEDSSPVPAEGIVPASKKKKGQSCNCTGEETPRVRGSSSEVRLLDRVKELEKENEELKKRTRS